MKFSLPTAFYAYPSVPTSVGEVVRAAAYQINRGGQAKIETWEDMRVSGKFVIAEICDCIKNADLFCADLTGLNANVVFELGYAIAQNKRIWLTQDTSFTDKKKDFDRFKTLTTIGYVGVTNSADLTKAFLKERPFEDVSDTIFDRHLKQGLGAERRDHLLYLKSPVNTEASNKLSRAFDKIKEKKLVSDPTESNFQSLLWYSERVFSSAGVLCHLLSPDRDGALLCNACYSLVAGLAYGFGKPLLMLADREFLAPLDYRDLLRSYRTANEAVQYFTEWHEPIGTAAAASRSARIELDNSAILAAELCSLRLGEYIAENEEDALPDYFIETAAYREALEGRNAIFVGRKGAGKSANLLKLASTLTKDARNLVCVIKPVAYELEGILSLFSEARERDERSFSVESLWKFLLVTEIANAVAVEIEQKQTWSQNEREREFLEFVNADDAFLRRDFSVRLERCLEALEAGRFGARNERKSLEENRGSISEILHAGILNELRTMLAGLLGDRAKVVVLVDNLDKAWDKRSDFDALATFFLGLLSASSRLASEFKRESSRKEPINLSLAIFVRTDIFYRILQIAREPDKIRHTRIEWTDPVQLLRVVEQRFAALHSGALKGSEIWTRYFCDFVSGIPTKEFILQQILQRPRDLLYLTNEALATAVNRGHGRVLESDILHATKLYSEHAVSSLLVEDVGISASLANIVYEFVGAEAIIGRHEVLSRLARILGNNEEECDAAVKSLCLLGFLGVEVARDNFRFAQQPEDLKKAGVLAARFAAESEAVPRYKVNRPFQPFLEISE